MFWLVSFSIFNFFLGFCYLQTLLAYFLRLAYNEATKDDTTTTIHSLWKLHAINASPPWKQKKASVLYLKYIFLLVRSNRSTLSEITYLSLCQPQTADSVTATSCICLVYFSHKLVLVNCGLWIDHFGLLLASISPSALALFTR